MRRNIFRLVEIFSTIIMLNHRRIMNKAKQKARLI
nr:MAG TPA: hypothetical protein [Caudoviricetes sp.]